MLDSMKKEMERWPSVLKNPIATKQTETEATKTTSEGAAAELSSNFVQDREQILSHARSLRMKLSNLSAQK